MVKDHGVAYDRQVGETRGGRSGNGAFLRTARPDEEAAAERVRLPRISGQCSGPGAVYQARQKLGFSLKEIRELLALRIAPDATCEQVKKRAEAKIRDLEDRILDLNRMKRALQRLKAACNGKATVSACPILEALADGKKR